jgi:hypothetical protein
MLPRGFLPPNPYLVDGPRDTYWDDLKFSLWFALALSGLGGSVVLLLVSLFH